MLIEPLGRTSLRTFSSLGTGAGGSTLSYILAETEERARELARRELMKARNADSVEICEGGKVLWIEHFEAAAGHSHFDRGKRLRGCGGVTGVRSFGMWAAGFAGRLRP